jgi:hypothetical protein
MVLDCHKDAVSPRTYGREHGANGAAEPENAAEQRANAVARTKNVREPADNVVSRPNHDREHGAEAV